LCSRLADHAVEGRADDRAAGERLRRAGDALARFGLARDQRTALVALGLLLLAIFFAKSAAAIGIHRAIIRFSMQQQASLQSRLMGRYQALPYAQYLARNSAEYVRAIQGLTDDFAHVVQMLLRVVADGLVLVVLLALLAWQDAAALALLVVLFTTVIYAYDRLFRRKVGIHGEESNRAAEAVVRGVQEGLGGLKEIRVLGKEGHFHQRVERAAHEYARAFTRTQVIGLAPRYLLELALVAFVVIDVWVNLWMGRDLAMLVPTLGVFAVASLRLMPAANTFSSSLIQIRYARDSVRRLHRDASTAAPPARPVREGGSREGFRALELDHVHFTYPDARQPAIEDASLQLRANESIGLVGPSGSGKTTLVDILLGLLEPQQGEVRYNDRPLAEALDAWRSQVAYLPQDAFLIDASLRSNVALGVPEDEIDAGRLEEALRQARLDEVAALLPEGVHTLIGERGVRLSGGQRQRVALARAFYHQREVLILDEATSALDVELEREIAEEIRQLRGRKTLIVITHGPALVRHCDRIYRLERGSVFTA
jgi:ABC-type multidrug transport system fused ATPase/permease subunit